MDLVVSSALEEICSQGSGGLSLSFLWGRLSVPSPSVKASVWRNLLLIPTLQFKSTDAAWSPGDPSIQCVEEAEKLDLRIVADEKLRDSFVGLYGAQSSYANISAVQRRVLERLAISRSNGVMQNQLAKEFGIEGKNLFYILRNLESRGLIAKQPAVVRTKEAVFESFEADSKTSSCVTTNIIYLSRYAKPLGSQQRFEISKEGCSTESPGKESEIAVGRNGLVSGSVRDMLIKDYVPAMQAVCNKLKQANGKVLVVSDIKRDLGYTGSHASHRAWRTISRRLKDAHMVEEFEAKVNNKVERCLRLLKEFSQKDLEPTSIGPGCFSDKDQQMHFGRRIQKFDQLVELPIDHQIYDMVDAKGSEGLAVMEVCDKLGIDKKKNYSRLCSLLSRFGMHIQAESHKKTTAFRVWTSGNSGSDHSGLSSSNPKKVAYSNPDQDPVNTTYRSAQRFLEYDHSTSEGDFAASEKSTEVGTDSQIFHGSPLDGKTKSIVVCSQNLQESSHEVCGAANEAEIAMTTNMDSVSSDSKFLALVNVPTSTVSHAYPLTTDAARREHRILERLQNEKLLLRAELHRWLSSLEKDKGSKLDRKTIDRILNKLQRTGHCKCITVNIPNVTNCGRNRSTLVVLHQSIQSLTPEIVSKIHDRIRAFEMETRGQGLPRCKNSESVPVLNDIQRSQNHEDLDTRASRAETMRANGFVLAKMIRAKLLHCFLWDYLSSSPDWKDAFLNEDQRQVSSLFSLETALKTMPLELFVQVVGSTQKFDDIIDNCKKGLRLSDLPSDEYRLLMDTLATGRLSLLIDILRRLKLIRLMSNGQFSDTVEGKHARLIHAMELKPYIEEPVSVIASSITTSFDLRPRIRHDFILSNREAVDEYWLTLEYCYAAADPRAAVQAFPGSAVHEVFLFRSWASIRVMTADQRAELLKRVVKDNTNERLSFKECEKIAKDLNLTVEQVLRAYRDKQQKRLNKFMGVQTSVGNAMVEKKLSSSSRKRKRSDNTKSERTAGGSSKSNSLEKQRVPSYDPFVQSRGDPSSEEDQDDIVMLHQQDDHQENEGEAGQVEDEQQCHSVINDSSLFKKKFMQLKRFRWTEEEDRQLVIQYVRYRATAGAKFHRVEWGSIPELPAAPGICKRRIAFLKRNKRFRKAIMRLCNVLSERYVRHLEKRQERNLNNDGHQVVVQYSVGESSCAKDSKSTELEGVGLEEEQWDDFNDSSVRKALESVLQSKQMAKLEVFKGTGSASGGWSKKFSNFEEHELGEVSPGNNDEELQMKSGGLNSPQRSRYQQLHQKFIKHRNVEASIARQVQESLAVSNAVELLKLVFLSTSSASNMPNFLAETLRRYSEHDLFAAYSYLRNKKVLIGGSCGQPFVLSQYFLHNVLKSPFPTNTGKRAVEFSSWLLERKHDLLAGGINLNEDLQCGDVYGLLSSVSSGELSIYPSLPEEGVGEAEDSRGLKRRAEDVETCEADKMKKVKFMTEGEFICRREKGFPGITISVRCVSLSAASAIDLFKEGKAHTSGIQWHDAYGTDLKKKNGSTSNSDDINELCNVSPAITVAKSDESPWEAMANYADFVISKCNKVQSGFLNPEVFKAVDTAIKKAGDQGLSIQEVCCLAGEKLCECMIDVLQTFRRALKVNAYDCIRVVDVLYRSKYFLTSGVSSKRHPQLTLSSISGTKCYEDIGQGSHERSSTDPSRDERVNVHDVHKVTILHLPEEDALPADEVHTSTIQERPVQSEGASVGRDSDSQGHDFCSNELCIPILPWLNADGTINKLVFNGLVRRIFGTVMQNPGMLEDEIIYRMDVLNPQSCRTLLELMILDGHLNVREMHQTRHSCPPDLLRAILGSSSPKEPETLLRRHFFANPKSSYLL